MDKMEIFRRTFAEINLENLEHNFNLLKLIAGENRFLCPMVKANAYGHGDIQVAQYLENIGSSHLGVCLIEEGLLLRNHYIKSDILVFRGFDKEGAQKIYDAQLTPIVSTWEQLKYLESVVDDKIKIHLKFDTGMNRLGFPIEEVEKLRNYFRQSKKLKLKAILSHFYQGEDAHIENGHSHNQALKMQQVYDFFRNDDVYVHLLNSGGIASFSKPEVQANRKHYLHSINWGFRPGLMLYGYMPDSQFTHLNLKPVMTFKSVVNNIRLVRKGESVSYGASWKASKDSIVAVVPVGYADGVHRVLSNVGCVLFAGQRAPIVGRICMDFLMIDVTHIVSPDKINSYNEEEVILFGFDQKNNFLSAEVNAQAMQSITWEILTSVGERVPRHFKGVIS